VGNLCRISARTVPRSMKNMVVPMVPLLIIWSPVLNVLTFIFSMHLFIVSSSRYLKSSNVLQLALKSETSPREPPPQIPPWESAEPSAEPDDVRLLGLAGSKEDSRERVGVPPEERLREDSRDRFGEPPERMGLVVKETILPESW